MEDDTITAGGDEQHICSTLDRACLESLCQQLGGERSAVAAFVAAFIRIWPDRLARVEESTRTANTEALLDAVLSIRSASRMIGALRLDAVSRDIEGCAQNGDLAGAARLIPLLEVRGEQAVEALFAYARSTV